MNKKRTSLDAIVSRTVISTPTAEPVASAPPPAKPADAGNRLATKQQTVYLPLAVHRQLRKLAFDEEGKMHDYLLEGLDLVFRQRGLPGIAELKKKHP